MCSDHQNADEMETGKWVEALVGNLHEFHTDFYMPTPDVTTLTGKYLHL